MASDEALQCAGKQVMGVMAGSAVHSVRKLGVDYALSKCGEKIRKVRQAWSGSQRWRKLCKLGLRSQLARLVYAGILLHASFGAAVCSPSKGELKVIQGMLG